MKTAFHGESNLFMWQHLLARRCQYGQNNFVKSIHLKKVTFVRDPCALFHPVSAAFLGPVKGLICMVDKGIKGLAMVWKGCHPQ